VVRKAVAASFAFQNIKKKFPMVLGRVNEVQGGVLARLAWRPSRSLTAIWCITVVGRGPHVLTCYGRTFQPMRAGAPAPASSCSPICTTQEPPIPWLRNRWLCNSQPDAHSFSTAAPTSPRKSSQPQLITRVAAQGPDASIDVDQAALRVTLDVIGLAGFGHDYQSVKQDTPAYSHMLVRPAGWLGVCGQTG
jgi:hypothetical protein